MIWAGLAWARSMMWTIFSSTLRSLESLIKPTGWSGWERRWFKGVMRKRMHGITDDMYCTCPCIFLKSAKLITPLGATKAVVMLLRYLRCLSSVMDTWCPGPTPPVIWMSRRTSVGFHRASPLASFFSKMLSLPLQWCSTSGLGNIPWMLCRFALATHCCSGLFQARLEGPAMPLQKLSTNTTDMMVRSVGVLHVGSAEVEATCWQWCSCWWGSATPVSMVRVRMHQMSSRVVIGWAVFPPHL
jgi:hypothetical protein